MGRIMLRSSAVIIMAALFSLAAFVPAVAQTKAVSKVLMNNASVLVILGTYAPGAVNPMTKRMHVLVYVIKGPQHTKRTDADGHVTTFSYPTGAVHFESAGTNSLTNIGTNTYQTLAVQLKQ
jgi:hypothetical protein